MIATQDLLKGKPSGEKVHKIEKITEKGEKDKKPKGLGRVVAGLTDWATMGLTDFDKRGDSLGQRIGKGSIDFMLGDLTDLDRKGNLFGGVNKLGDVQSKKKIIPPDKTNTSISSTSKVNAHFDFKRGVGVINGKDVSVEEYTNFQNLSQREKLQQYGQVKGNGNNILPLDVNSVKAKNVSDFASYEEGSDEEIVVVAPSPSKSNQYQDKEESFVPLVLGGGGGGEDPYSTLYEGG